MSYPFKAVSATVTSQGTAFGQITVDGGVNFDVGATVLVTSTLNPAPWQLIVAAQSGSVLTLKTPDGRLADLTGVLTTPAGISTVTQLAGSQSAYAMFGGAPGRVFYMSPVKTLGPDTGATMAIGDMVWSLSTTTTGDAILYFCTAAGPAAAAWANAQVLVPGMCRSYGGHVFICTTGGTAATGSEPATTTGAIFHGADNVYWRWITDTTPATWATLGIL